MIHRHGSFVFVATALLTLVFVSPTLALDLARRPLLGITAENLSRTDRDSNHLVADQGVLVQQIVPGSAAERAGIKAGDILLSIGAARVGSVAAFLKTMRLHHVGEAVTVTVLRVGERHEFVATLAGLPLEADPDFGVIYDAVPTDTGLRRVIVTVPRTDPERAHPALLLIGGIGNFSIDTQWNRSWNPGEPYRRLLAALTRRGFVTMRVEKSGVGDSEGSPAPTVDMETELTGYIAGLKSLKTWPGVDPARVFIVGHSIGSILGPLAAAVVPVRGIVVLEGVGTTWFEYELINVRRQLTLSGLPPVEIADQLRLKEWAMHRLLIERQPRAALLAERPEAAKMIDYPASDEYMRQVAAQNLPGLWSRLDLPVLVIHGSADFVTSEDDNRAIVDAVNRTHPGRGEFASVGQMDHWLNQVETEAESWRLRHLPPTAAVKPIYQAHLDDVVGEWLSAVADGRHG
jgi:pimeloyl-ACP methyl ester carboxylesterase